MPGVQLAEGGVADLSGGEVVGNPIGANVQTAGFDVSHIQSDAVYRDNDRNLDTMAMPRRPTLAPSDHVLRWGWFWIPPMVEPCINSGRRCPSE